MSKRFFRLTDHSAHGRSQYVRLGEIISVSDPHSPASSRLWNVDVVTRDGGFYQIVGEMDAVYKARDELLAALEDCP